MSTKIIRQFLAEIARVLRPSGYCAMWADKFNTLNFDHVYASTLHMRLVDMITWDKLTFGMGYRSRRRGEHLLIIQKEPIRAAATWKDHGIPDVWPEKILNRKHPHEKPFNLQARIISAVVPRNGIVIDPCAGSYSVRDAAVMCGRNFLGCDILG